MLPPSYLDQMPDAFVQLAQQVEDEILQDVARRIAKMDGITETANWQLWRYQQTEALREDVVKLLARYSGKSEATIRKLLKEAATEAMEREAAIYYHYGLEPPPFEESAALNNLLTAGAKQTCGTWQNLTATTANTVTGAFERTLDVAWGKVATGAFDYKIAVKQAVDSLADDLPAVTYPSGHTDSLEVAARRAVLTGVNQTAGKLQEARMDEMGAEFVETSAHGGARPSHAEWQGRQFHRGGAVDYLGKHYPDFEQATGYGTGEGLCGWNCRHSFFAVFPELGDPPTWTEESLQELNARNIEYNGKLYTQYEINQMQRARERNVRKWKKRYLSESAAGLDTTNAAVHLKAARQSLSEFAKATGGRVDSARTSVPKFGRSEAGKASYQARQRASSSERSSSLGVGSNKADLDYINSDSYRAKFNSVSDIPALNHAVYKYCKAAVTHQSGDYYEDLTILRMDGSLLGQTSSKTRNETQYTNALRQAVRAEKPYSLISIHNHGTNVPPSGADFGSAGEKKYAFGIVACHDGRAYYYSSAHARPFLPSLIDETVDKYLKAPYNLDRISASEKALNIIAEAFGSAWRELL